MTLSKKSNTGSKNPIIERTIENAIRAFLALKGLPTDTAHVATVLCYPAPTILSAIVSHEASAALVPEIQRNKDIKFENQLDQIFKDALNQLVSSTSVNPTDTPEQDEDSKLKISEEANLVLRKTMINYY